MILIKLKSIILFFQKVFLRNEVHLSKASLNYSPIFIIGAPRTGSTFLFQLLIKYYNVTYISNLMAVVPMFMSKIGCFFRKRMKMFNQIKDSNYGVVNGFHSPNEASRINDFWFDNKKYNAKVESTKTTFAKLSNCFESPLLIKAMGNSLRVPDILKIFPNAKFIHIKRDLNKNISSIIKARAEIEGDQNQWWSLKPIGYEVISKEYSPKEQVEWQINSINNFIEESLLHNPNYIQVNYEDLCSNTEVVLEKTGLFLDLSRNDLTFNSSDVKI